MKSLMISLALLVTLPCACGSVEVPGDAEDVASYKQSLDGYFDHLNGMRLNNGYSATVYLVMDGCKRGIADAATYNRIFRDWRGIQDMSSVRLGDWPLYCVDIDSDSFLMLSPTNGGLYLYTNKKRYWVSSPSVRNKYYFDDRKAIRLPDSIIDSIPRGFDLY